MNDFLREFCFFTFAASWISELLLSKFFELFPLNAKKGLINLTCGEEVFLCFVCCVISVNSCYLMSISLRMCCFVHHFSEIYLRRLFCIWLILFRIVWWNKMMACATLCHQNFKKVYRISHFCVEHKIEYHQIKNACERQHLHTQTHWLLWIFFIMFTWTFQRHLKSIFLLLRSQKSDESKITNPSSTFQLGQLISQTLILYWRHQNH